MRSGAYRYSIWLLAAAGVHAALLFGKWGFLRQDASYSVSPQEGIEVNIVDSAPGETAEAAAPPAPAQATATPPTPDPTPPDPTPPTPDPAPAPPPDPVPPPSDKMEMPDPDKPKKSEPKPQPVRPKPATTHASTTTPRPHAAVSSSGAQTATAGAPAVATGARSGGGVPGGGGENSKPGYLSNPHPPYPAESKMRHEQGVVMLAVSIDERGEVTGVSVSQSSGFPRLDDSAREGVMRWRFRPAKTAGFPVASHLAVPIRFRLSD